MLRCVIETVNIKIIGIARELKKIVRKISIYTRLNVYNNHMSNIRSVKVRP